MAAGILRAVEPGWQPGGGNLPHGAPARAARRLEIGDTAGWEVNATFKPPPPQENEALEALRRAVFH